MDLQDNFIAELGSVQNLELLARQVVEGFLLGLHKSPFHGFSVEFAEHRLYNTGESTRHIDWKVFARTDRLYVKRFEEETNLRCQLVIDASSSMYFSDDSEGKKNAIRKIDFSCVAAAAIMHLLKQQRDAFGLTAFADTVLFDSREKSSSVHHKLIIRELQNLLQQKSLNKKTAAADCLHEIAEKIHRRSLVVIFSDMFENIKTEDESYRELFSALRHLRHNKHEVILFHVMHHPKEMEFDYANRPYRFIDLETGEQVKLVPTSVKQAYRSSMEKFYNDLKLRCGQYQIDFVKADIDRGFRQILLPYLTHRVKYA